MHELWCVLHHCVSFAYYTWEEFSSREYKKIFELPAQIASDEITFIRSRNFQPVCGYSKSSKELKILRAIVQCADEDAIVSLIAYLVHGTRVF